MGEMTPAEQRAYARYARGLPCELCGRDDPTVCLFLGHDEVVTIGEDTARLAEEGVITLDPRALERYDRELDKKLARRRRRQEYQDEREEFAAAWANFADVWRREVLEPLVGRPVRWLSRIVKRRRR